MEKKDIEQAGKEVVKRKSNGKNSPVIGGNGIAPINAEENALFCQYALDMFHAPSVDLSNPDAVADAIDGYFKYCVDRGLRPGNLGLYAALGLSKQDVSNAINGYSKKLSSSTIDLIKKAKQALSTYRELLGSQGKLNPVTLIFWQKNYDGLKDQQDIVLTPNTGLDQEHTPEEIGAKVLDDIPIDDDNIDTI
ncbi:hypothetical protein GKG47_11810 [Lactonifactor sp. BIOML-A3]|uniref:hypothetical protein n=1 Tax=unclassified Lactonifactor TaxID=2636670 RepID=UPI0012AFF098|nr:MULTISPECIES: hypothetical protein [unclassified Lactonifactor]MSA01052.1 hypothetical protein [Lactonifactor sp. BIOML-A5]MSA10303.1 hypothetical protein [Lactonifactor sp. BIOML-A4]MSA13113.1 hypothetical protein [Lactonifactor sp. BIOML-A3]MSA19275.1 hypothetical protein [Lactonifactor sp. BIOML-A2]MSA38352.1 hypothetical protein [Lactonifactor sp. BIOML-A1]